MKIEISLPRIPNTNPDKNQTLGLCLLLVACTVAVYWPLPGFEFLNYDDNLYVTANPRVTSGLGWANLRWAFATAWGNNWIPLTWLSHMLDCTLFGVQPGRHHLVNLLFHLLNTLLLFLFLRRCTRQPYPSFLVALLFGVHPLHVESVAWIAERKDLLSTGFGLLTMVFYGNYVSRPTAWRYALILLAFTLGLLAKPMVVTLPFLLLLLDYWPLGRWRPGFRPSGRLLAEKAPLLLLTVLFAILTYRVQAASGAVASLHHYPWAVRVSNALVSYLLYLGKFFWPSRLAIIYPHPGQVQWGLASGAALLLLALSWLAIRTRQRFPYVLVGWGWYLGTLVPVIGLVQVGNQALADRYTYLPLVGIFIILAWGGEQLIRSRPGARSWLLTLVGIAVLLLSVVAARQVRVWAKQSTLFAHALAVTGPNAVAEFQFGTALVQEGKWEEAAARFQTALRIAPEFPQAHNNLAYVLDHQGKNQEAIAHYRQALTLAPNDPEGHYNLGLVLMRQWQLPEAIHHFQTALRLAPDFHKARENLTRAERLQSGLRRPPF